MPEVKDLGLANNEIVSVQKTSGTGLPGSTDTYTITLRDGTVFTFNVTNGNNGLSGLTRRSFTSMSDFQTFTLANEDNIACIVYCYEAFGEYQYRNVNFVFGYSDEHERTVILRFVNTDGEWQTITTLSDGEELIVYYFENAAGVAVVPTSRTIAGLNLESDIAENALFDKMSIKGRYATLSALQTADPNHGYCYLVEENNHWYFWNGTEWADGGVYLATSQAIDDFLSERSVNAVKNKVVTAAIQKENGITPNLINGDARYDLITELMKEDTTVTEGGYLSNNAVVAEPLACYSDYLPVKKGAKIYIAKNVGFTIAGEYYDFEKTYQNNLSLSVGDDTNGGYVKTSGGNMWSAPNDGYVRINIKIGMKDLASIKSIALSNETKKLSWLKIGGESIDGESLNLQQPISEDDGTPIISFIRNHMWLKNGTLYTSSETFGSTETIPLENATTITVFPYYKYGQEEAVGNGAFVNSSGQWIGNIDDQAEWDENHLTFTTPVPDGAYGVQLNAVFRASSAGDYYSTSGDEKYNISSEIYVIKNNSSKVLKWLRLGNSVVSANNIDTTPLFEAHNIGEGDGTPIVPYIRNHMWLKNGALYSSNANYGSTQTIPLGTTKVFQMLPLYKYNKESNVDNGAFVNQDGTWFASLMSNAVWDSTQTYLIVTVPDGAYGFQINAILTNDDKYSSEYNASNNASKTLYYSTNYAISIPWIKVETTVNWDNIPNGVITYDSLNSDVKSRLNLPYDESYKYWDQLNKPFDFQGKNLVAFGDSITVGVANEGSGNYGAGSNSYINLFASKFSMSFSNQAVSGSTITSGVNELTPICDKVDAYTFLNSANEFIFIAGGTNDFNSDAPLGQLGDTQTTTFYGALDHICQRLQSVAPNSTVIFITPINVNTTNFPRKASGSTLTLNKYRNAIYEVATKYKFNVVDGSTIGFAKEINTTWGNLMIAPSDGTHPTLAGHALYFRGLCGKLK